ncbi:hypothetical protein LTR85_002944 [Meristemomyces frigidus]|nr:hypothetical protein LTR85_002944 [Meristemomyces frigidus]
MHPVTLPSLAATLLATLATAQLNLPTCALTCFNEAVGNSTCGATDYYCQCTTGAAVIQSHAISCLCGSSCTTVELLQVIQDSNKVCSSAVAASSQTYIAATVGLDACASSATAASTGTGTVASSSSATATGKSGASSSTASAISSGATSTASSSASTSGGNGLAVVCEGAVLGLAGLAALLL